MSRASKLTLAGTSLGAVVIVVFVHWAQTEEKKVSCPFDEKSMKSKAHDS